MRKQAWKDIPETDRDWVDPSAVSAMLERFPGSSDDSSSAQRDPETAHQG